MKTPTIYLMREKIVKEITVIEFYLDKDIIKHLILPTKKNSSRMLYKLLLG